MDLDKLQTEVQELQQANKNLTKKGINIYLFLNSQK